MIQRCLGSGEMRRRSFASKGRFDEVEPEGCASIRKPQLKKSSLHTPRLCDSALKTFAYFAFFAAKNSTWLKILSVDSALKTFVPFVIFVAKRLKIFSVFALESKRFLIKCAY